MLARCPSRLITGSVREPTQVFTLLETIYHAFDGIARHRRVFKVETIGDCYGAHYASFPVSLPMLPVTFLFSHL
jgi:Adenylate and Guanylate cyclase catalytic domain